MATKTITKLLDDMGGGEANETVTFGIDGHQYEIDLNDEHAGQLREALEPWVAAGRKVGGRVNLGTGATKRTQLPAQRAPMSKSDRHAIQLFAQQRGLPPVAERGRIATSTLSAWDEAGRPMQ